MYVHFYVVEDIRVVQNIPCIVPVFSTDGGPINAPRVQEDIPWQTIATTQNADNAQFTAPRSLENVSYTRLTSSAKHTLTLVRLLNSPRTDSLKSTCGWAVTQARVYDTLHPEHWLSPAAWPAHRASFYQLAQGAPGCPGTIVHYVDLTSDVCYDRGVP